MQYENRRTAARALLNALTRWNNDSNAVICALPRGGVELGVELATAMNLPLYLLHVKKIVHPLYSEVAVGAVSDSTKLIQSGWEESPQVQGQVLNAREIIAQRKEKYKWTNPNIKGKSILLVDDGIATGLTMELAVSILRKQSPKEMILAVPVASLDAYSRLCSQVDVFTCPYFPHRFDAVGSFYKDFPQVSDEEVIRLLQSINKKSPAEPGLKMG
jgi:putative phosphoribosyl transferase